MRTESASQALLLKAYQQDAGGRPAGARPADPAGPGAAPAPREVDTEPRVPRELSKGRLLDIYG